MRKAPQFLAIVIGLAGSAAQAQPNDQLTSQFALLEGFHLYGANVYSSYVSSAYPISTNVLTPGAANVGYDLSYGVSGAAGWRLQRGEKLTASVTYAGSYNQSQNYSSLSAFGHNLNANLSFNITPKWTVNLSGTGQYQTFSQYLFTPTNLSVIAQTPATFNDLAASMSVGTFSSGQASSMQSVAGAGTTLNPATSLLFGNRVLSYATQASLSYQATTRLSFHIAGVTAAGEDRRGGTSGLPVQSYVMPHSIGITAGVSLNYALTPRTQIGGEFTGARTSNRYQGAYTTAALASLGRKMGEHWFLHASAGMAYTTVVQQVSGSPISRQVIGSGSLGYQLESHTFLASYNRTSMEANGFAVGTSAIFSGAWSWRRRGGRWGTIASVGQQELGNTGFSNLSGWTVSAGSTVSLVGNVILTAQYAYARHTGTYFGGVTKLSVNSIRISLGWAPQGHLGAMTGPVSSQR